MAILRVTAQFGERPTVQTEFYAKFPIRMIMSLYSTKEVPLVTFLVIFLDSALRLKVSPRKAAFELDLLR